MRSKPVFGLCLALTVLGGGVGCDSVGEAVGPKRFSAEVTIDDETVTVYSSSNEHSQKGVGYMRGQQWADAIRELNLAVAANPQDDFSLRALAFSYDKAGDRAKAYENYNKANLLMQKPDPMVTKRLRDLKP